MRSRLFVIKDNADKRSIMTAVYDFVGQALQSGALDITVSSASKTRAQESRYHAMIGDISKQVDFDSTQFSAKVWKAKLLDQFQHELALAGTPLSKPGETTISMDGQRVVQIRPESSGFRVKEASDFIEYLYSVGAEHNISWSDPETQAMYRDYFEREAHQ
jgi:hypothetical protein